MDGRTDRRAAHRVPFGRPAQRGGERGGRKALRGAQIEEQQVADRRSELTDGRVGGEGRERTHMDCLDGRWTYERAHLIYGVKGARAQRSNLRT